MDPFWISGTAALLVLSFIIGSLAHDAQIDCTDKDRAKVFSGIITVDMLSFGDKKDLSYEIC
jgi:hypothetical protein